MKKYKKILGYCRLLLAVGILAAAFMHFDFQRIWAAVGNADLGWAVTGFISGFCATISAAVKLKTSLGYIVNIPFTKVLFSLLSGKLYGYFAPGTLGTDVSVMLSLRSEHNNLPTTAVILIIDRLLSLPSIIIIMALFIPFTYHSIPSSVKTLIVGSIGITLVTFVAGVIVLRFNDRCLAIGQKVPARKKWIAHLFAFAAIVLQNKRRASCIVALGVVMNGFIQVSTFSLLKAIHLNVDFLYSITVLPLNSFLVMIPISIMGIGVREGGFYYLLSGYSVSMEDVIAFNLLGYFFEFITIGIAWLTITINTLKNQSHENVSSE